MTFFSTDLDRTYSGRVTKSICEREGLSKYPNGRLPIEALLGARILCDKTLGQQAISEIRTPVNPV